MENSLINPYINPFIVWGTEDVRPVLFIGRESDEDGLHAGIVQYGNEHYNYDSAQVELNKLIEIHHPPTS